MDVILKQDVEGLGRRGEIVSIANGYYRNYILPKGLGFKATKGAEIEAEAMRKAGAVKNEESRADAEEIATKLVPHVIQISARTDEAGTLFGSVGAVDIAAAIEEQVGLVIDRRALKVEAPFKTVGSYMVTAQIHSQVQFPVSIEITSAE